ncbi:hypothetical protein G9272_00775 [Streptomyces asoensis]|uniref:BetI-type transcriptional repressor C-terminal domain-containing protein n=1 Tax=Streptomyces asoensis TaxID=249586 RepID=A0A6M4WGK3_9ACTN|nr:hypothetical protein G9272_00775 [Streptomyces asoensis]
MGIFATRYRIAAEGLAAGLRRALAAGRLKPEAGPDQVAREILAVSDGLQIQWAIAQGRLDFVAEYRAYLDRLARTLTTDGRALDRPQHRRSPAAASLPSWSPRLRTVRRAHSPSRSAEGVVSTESGRRARGPPRRAGSR